MSVSYCKLVIFSLLLIFSGSALAQDKLSTKSKKAIEFYNSAKNYYINQDLDEAIVELDKAIAKDKKFIEAYYLKADILMSLKRYDDQVAVIKTGVALDSSFFTPIYFNAGVALFNIGEYDAAVEWFKLFKRHNGTRRTTLNADNWIEKSHFAKEVVSRPVPFQPVSVGDGINSIYNEYWPSLTADEETMVFTVLLPRDSVLFSNNSDLPINSRNFHEDFFISKKVGGVWQPRTNMKGINTDSNEGAQTLSSDGRWMFFTACGRNDSHGGCDIYFSQKTADGWSKPVNIGPPVNTPHWESQPFFSSDGTTLYFVSNRPGGIGKKDIWKANIVGQRSDGAPIFGAVENLGNTINTIEDESSPFMHPDNETFYFSSEGWHGMGQMDIFFSRKNKDTGRWQIPVNLGYPINTSADETGMVVNTAGTRAYFSSDGLADAGKRKDIYHFELPANMRPKPVSYVKGRVFDRKTNLPLTAQVVLTRLEDGETEASTNSVGWSGEYMVCLPAGHNYALNVRRKGYMFHSENFALKNLNTIADPYQIDVYLSPLIAGERVVLRNVFYATNSSVLERESIVELDMLVEVLEENPDIRLEIGGHTDNTGAQSYNFKLSKDRAQSVFDYLVFKGIERSRLKYEGYGMKEPVATNDTEEGRAQNRRTEVKILDDED